MIDCTRRR